jgi:O-methyltransferase
MKSVKKIIRYIVKSAGYDLHKIGAQSQSSPSRKKICGIPDSEFYQPLFSPWLGYGEFEKFYQIAKDRTLVSRDRCWILYQCALQAAAIKGEFWECGVYKGGTALMLAHLLMQIGHSSNYKMLRLFDTFQGMPKTHETRDWHEQGDFADTSLESVRGALSDAQGVNFHRGFIPETFIGLESCPIGFAHIDVDIYQSILDCCSFIYPRLLSGAIMVFDDYGHPTCPGAREAVDDFFKSLPEEPLVLPTGQALVYKLQSKTSPQCIDLNKIVN